MNERTLGILFIGIAASVAVCSASIQSAAAAVSRGNEDQQMRTATETLDRNIGQQDRTQALSKQYGVPESTVASLRRQGLGWGEVTARLSVAQNLSRSQTAQFPNTGAALNRVGTLRDEGHGWSNISQEMNFKLGPTISSLQPPVNPGARTGAEGAGTTTFRSSGNTGDTSSTGSTRSSGNTGDTTGMGR